MRKARSDGALMEEELRPRKTALGQYLIAQGILSREKVNEAIEMQRERVERAGQFELSGFLISEGLVSAEQLQKVNEKYRRNERFGDGMVRDGIISSSQLDEAIAQKKPHEFIGETLMNLGFVDRQELYETLKKHLNVPPLPVLLINEGLVDNETMRRALNAEEGHETLGEILVELGYLTVIQLNAILKETNKRLQIGHMLVEAGQISREDLELALEKQRFSKLPLGETLINDGLIKDVELFGALARQYGMRFHVVDDQELATLNKQRLTGMVGKDDALRYRIVPLSFNARKLEVAVFDPTVIAGVGGFDAIMNFDLSFVLTREGDFIRAFKTLYGEVPRFEAPIGEIEGLKEFSFVSDTIEDDKDSKYVVVDSDREAERLLNTILSYAIRIGASDIHLEPSVDGFHVRLRIDGMLIPLLDRSLTPRIRAKQQAIIGRLKVLSRLDIAERRLPQDGSFRLSYPDPDSGEEVGLDFRLATCTTEFGEGATIRVIDSRKASIRLDQLGHSHAMLHELSDNLQSLSGMLLVTGPTGAGKTSTLYAMLNFLLNPNVKVVTAEDPVEFKLPGVFQVQMNQKIGLTFQRALKSFLRMDPDVILLGEIRDREAAEIAMEAAITGHMLLSSLHTNDAIGAVSRLRDLGISDLLIANSLKGVLSQRLVRTLCIHCRRPYLPEKSEWERIFPEEPIHFQFFRADGCAHCNHTGYRGRTVISEALFIDDEVGRVILQGGDERAIYKAAKQQHMRFMIDDAITKLHLTTVDEIIRVLPHESVIRHRKEQATLAGRFTPFVLPPESALEYQTNLVLSPRGLPRGRVRELDDQFRLLRSHLFEGSTDLTHEEFKIALERHLGNEARKVGCAQGDRSIHRISLLSRADRSVMMVETMPESLLKQESV